MTTITAEHTTHDASRRLTRRTITSFLAGAILAGGIAVGVTVASDDGTPAAHANAHTVAATPEPGCFVLRGAC